MRYKIVAALAGVLLAAACGPKPAAAPATETVDAAAVGSGLDSLRVRYIALQNAGDAAGLAGLFGEVAGLDLYGFPRMTGRAAIQAALTADFAARKYTLTEINPVTRSVRTNSDAIELGTYHNMHDAKGTVDHEWGRYIGSFVKDPDGQWRIYYLMAFPDSTKADK